MFGITVLVQNSFAQPIASARVVVEGIDVLTDNSGCFSTGVGLTGTNFNRNRSMQVSATGYKSTTLDYKTDGIDSFMVTLIEETAIGDSTIKKITPNNAESSTVAKCDK